MNSAKARAKIRPATNQTLKPSVVFLSSRSHRRCGIAKFTRDLGRSLKSLFGEMVELQRAAVINRSDKNLPRKSFIYFIRRNYRGDYAKCAEFLNRKAEVRLVSVQHEFGLFGGERGDYLLDFFSAVKKPVFLTFHTVIAEPDRPMLGLVKKLGRKARKIVVMTERSRRLLQQVYGFPKSKIEVIPHGIASFHYEPDNQKIKKILGLPSGPLLFTHGFLSRNKGIEYVLDALPGVVRKYPGTLYLLAGRTHPNVKLEEGESYRQFLRQKVKNLGIQKNVKFVNRYITTAELVDYLRACDIYLSTSLDPNQAVSGTFAYALGSGRPVVSTAFPHAREELKKDQGILVKPGDSKNFEKAILTLLGNARLRKKMGLRCFFKTRGTTWKNVALAYSRIFAELIPHVGKSLVLPQVVLKHLFRMTDDFGLLQFAKLTEPLKRSGYTVDDNARALAVAVMYHQKHRQPDILRYIRIYLSFLEFTFSRRQRNFRNYVNFDCTFNLKRNRAESFENPTSRAFYALARTAAAEELPQSIRRRALRLLKLSWKKPPQFTYSRSIAFYLKALYFYGLATGKPKVKKEVERCAELLHSRFERHRSGRWIWFEGALTYSNGILPEALYLAFRILGDKKYLETANQTANFLIQHSFKESICMPIGQQYWFKKGGKRSYHDQQPEEVASLVEMLKTAYAVNKDKFYRGKMVDAYKWFLGNNTLGQVVCDFQTGGCYDGIGEKEVNLNQGAESTLSYLTARLIVSRR